MALHYAFFRILLRSVAQTNLFSREEWCNFIKSDVLCSCVDERGKKA